MSQNNTLNTCFNKNGFYIKFYPGIKASLGCEKSTLILGRLEYWFEKYSHGFYKFLEPCPHPLYREGDSWAEEIGFSRKIFSKAFDLIGVRYKSKSSFKRAKDKFQGKLYASYHDRKTNRTYFIRNHQFASEFIKGLFRTKKTAKPLPQTPTPTKGSAKHEAREDKKGVFPNAASGSLSTSSRDSVHTNTSALSLTPAPITPPLPNSSPDSKGVSISSPTPDLAYTPSFPEDHSTPSLSSVPASLSSPKNGRSWNGQDGRSYGGTIGGKDLPLIQRNTPSLSPDILMSPPPVEAEHTKMTEEMIKIWEEEIGGTGISSPSSGLTMRLLESLKASFDASVEDWRKYCQLISSSKFLMGEAQNKFFKKAWITWAIKPETVEKIRGGAFNLGDRPTRVEEKRQEIDRALSILDLKKKGIEEAIDTLKQTAKKARTEKVKQAIQAFSAIQKEKVRREFEKHLVHENNSLTQEFKRAGWRGLFVETYFTSYVEEHVESYLFPHTLEEEVTQKTKESGLLTILDALIKDMTQLKTRRKGLITPESQENNPEKKPEDKEKSPESGLSPERCWQGAMA